MSNEGLWTKSKARYREFAAIAAPPKKPRAYWNWLRSNLEMARSSSEVRAHPLRLTFDPTNLCQLECPLCPTGLRIQDRPPGRVRLHFLEHLLEEVGDYVFFMDFFNWGEPLLNKDLEKMIRLAADKRIVTYVSSNLSLPIPDARIDALVRSGLSELIVSLDGATQSTYSTYRRNGNFDLAFDNMRRILERKRSLGMTRPAVVWRYFVYRWNEGEMELARKKAAEIGVDRLVFATPYLDEGRFPLSAEDRNAMKTWASTLPEFNRYHASNPSYEDPQKPILKRGRCDWHYMSSAINPDGGLAPCCAVFEKDYDFGKLADDRASYMSVINNDTYRAVRDQFAGRRTATTSTICERCPTPAMMPYARYANRQIVAYTLVSLCERVRRWIPSA